MRPDVGTQPEFRKSRPPAKYRYDDSLSPALEWDGQNAARDRAEALIEKVLAAETIEDARAAARELRAISRPFLNWAGKAERLSFEVPTLPLFVHERLSTKAILETLQGHRRDKQMDLDLFGDPRHSIADQVLRAYEHRDQWVNRMILGDSLVVMNSLLHYENLGGQVQMIYMDPPYGVRFGSNFQPFVRKRDVKDNDDADMTREPEMVQAYRDTWQLGIHSYLTYLRDRLLLARELLSPTGSIFVQISDENLHHVRELMDEVFGKRSFIAAIAFRSMMPLESGEIESVTDYLCWYGGTGAPLKYRNLFQRKNLGRGTEFVFVEAPDGSARRLAARERAGSGAANPAALFKRSDLASSGYTPSCTFPIKFEGATFTAKRGKSWRTTQDGVGRLKAARRLFVLGKRLYYKIYLSDFGYDSLTNVWNDTIEFGERLYAVQTTPTVVQRCVLMTTDPGDLVLDPTCGSGTTAYVAEKWGRRWITCDTSRVPLALARQRLLTATFDWYELKDEGRGPAGGFVYKRRQNTKGEEVGGIVPHVTLKSIANNEPPKEEVLVDRPEKLPGITRVTGPFCFEATIPTATNWDQPDQPAPADGAAAGPQAADQGVGAGFAARMIEILRHSPALRLPGNQTITFRNVRPPAKSLSLSAEAEVDATAAGQRATVEEAAREAMEKSGSLLPISAKTVGIVFGPENGAVAQSTVFEAAREARAKGLSHLYVIGFAIEPNARQLIEKADHIAGISATYVQATPDILMGDLLKNLRSSQIFSVCGSPEVAISRAASGEFQVQLLGLDVFDPVTMTARHSPGRDVPAWFLDADYNGLCFHVTQAFFPRTGAWEKLAKALKADYDDAVWDHLAGDTSAPFPAGEHRQLAVKVIDDRGNELLVVRPLPA